MESLVEVLAGLVDTQLNQARAALESSLLLGAGYE
jgi:hypothetical protein